MIIHLFYLDLQADKASKILNLNRNPEMKKAVGLIELDESYFGRKYTP
jgi:hypothetical protein